MGLGDVIMTEVKKSLKNEISDKEGFRMSTPMEIASYKAGRLKSTSIADLGAGIGTQAIQFAMVSDLVKVVETDTKRLEILRKTSRKLMLDNIEFIHGDVLDSAVVAKLGEVKIVHSDPARKKLGRSWNLRDLQPNPMKIMSKYRCQDFSFDLPVQISRDDIPEEWEKEYISLGGELKRLSVYSNSLRRYSKSAITLPSGDRVVEDIGVDREFDSVSVPDEFVHELDQSVQVSGLIPEFLKSSGGLKFLYSDRQKTFVTSDSLPRTSLIVRSYRAIDSASSWNDLRKKLRNEGGGKVFMRFRVDSSRYYEMRKSLEEGLMGGLDKFIFKFSGIFYIAEKVK